MKRSEMLELMASNLYIANTVGIPQEEWESIDSYLKQLYVEQAELLLSLQEYHGMRPPEPSGDLASYLVDGEWEPEDSHKSGAV